MQKILNFFSKIFSQKYLPISLTIVIVGLLVSNFQTCRNLSNQKAENSVDRQMYEQNINALGDTLTNRFDKKIKAIVSENTSYLVNKITELEKYDKDMYIQLKNIKGSFIGINSKIDIIIPTLISELNNFKQDPTDSTKFTIPWTFPYEDEGFKQVLYGNTSFRIFDNKPAEPIKSIVDTNKINVNLKYNFVEKNNKYVVNAYSLSPIVKFTELNGALVLDKLPSKPTKQNPWSFGPYLGVGLNTDLVGGSPRFGWSMGFGGSYNIFAKIKSNKIK